MSRTHQIKDKEVPATSLACSFCQKKFRTVWGKSEHELKHLNMRIQCSDCDKTFSNRGNLSRHKKTHTKTFASVQVGTLYSFDGARFHCGECSVIYEHSEEDAYWVHIGTHYSV